jgi:hypothetical protein
MDGQEGQYQYSESYSLHLLLDFLALFMKACHPTLTSEQDGMPSFSWERAAQLSHQSRAARLSYLLNNPFFA